MIALRYYRFTCRTTVGIQYGYVLAPSATLARLKLAASGWRTAIVGSVGKPDVADYVVQ